MGFNMKTDYLQFKFTLSIKLSLIVKMCFYIGIYSSKRFDSTKEMANRLLSGRVVG